MNARIEKTIRYLAFFIIFLSSFGAQLFYFDSQYGKVSLYRLLVLLFFLIVFYAIGSKRVKIIYNKQAQFSIFFLCIWLAWSYFTVLWCVDVHGWLKNSYYTTTGILLCLLLPAVLKNKSHIMIAYGIFVSGILIQFLLGAYEAWTSHLIINTNDRWIGFPIVFHHNTNDLSTFFYVGGVTFLAIAFFSKKFFIRLFLLIIASLMGFLIFKAGSRANLIGFITSVIFIIVVRFRREMTESRQRVVLSLIALFFLGFFLWKVFGLNINFYGTSNSDSIRLNLLRNSIDLLNQSNWLGIGGGQIQYYMMNFGKYDTHGIIDMHNWWAEILLSYGILIFVLYVIFYFRLVLTFFRYVSSPLCFIFAAILCGMTVSCISSSSLTNLEGFWVFQALCVSLQNLNVSELLTERSV